MQQKERKMPNDPKDPNELGLGIEPYPDDPNENPFAGLSPEDEQEALKQLLKPL